MKKSELKKLIKESIKSILEEEKAVFSKIIKQSREKGKFEDISDDEIIKVLKDAQLKLFKNKKLKCKNCGGGFGVCVFGACFSGKSLSWPI